MFLFTSLVLISACSKDGIEGGQGAWAEVPKYLKDFAETSECAAPDITGVINFYVFTTPSYQDNPEVHGEVSANFFDEMNGEAVDKGTLQIGNSANTQPASLSSAEASSNNGNEYRLNFNAKELYGGSASIRLINGNSVDMDESYNLPSFINISNSSLLLGTFKDINNQNNSFNWTGDSNNALGVALILSYQPESPLNVDLKNQGHTEQVKNVILTQDTGNYTFSSDDFNGIPMGAYVEMSMARGNCDVIENGSDKFLITGYIVTTSGFHYYGLN